MSIEILVIVALVVINVVLLFLVLRRRDSGGGDTRYLEDQIERLRVAVEGKLDRSQKNLFDSLHTQQKHASDLMNDIVESLTEVREGNKQVFSVTQELQDLKRVLTHQKQRGNLGERALEEILSNMLPPGMYEMQYRFDDGQTVDAIIHTKDGVIPIDAKYSLDNYERLMSSDDEEDIAHFQTEFKKDIQKRIDETAKYIRPREGTLPFAFMFIPAEGIYYDLLINTTARGAVNTQNLIEYAYNKKKVIIVSPTTFYAYLQSVLFGFKAFKVEENARFIEEKVRELMNHLDTYEEYMYKLGVTLSTTVGHYNNAYKEFKKVDKDMYKITGEKIDIDPLVIDKPGQEE